MLCAGLWFLYLFIFLSWAPLKKGVAAAQTAPRNLVLQVWADVALGMMRTLNCSVALNTQTEECELVRKMPSSQMTVYAAGPGEQVLTVVLPEAVATSRTEHHGVLVIDPFPSMQFGHLVFVFLVDKGLTDAQCNGKRGGMLRKDRQCIYTAPKPQCRNTLVSEILQPKDQVRLCEFHFLPFVTRRRSPASSPGSASIQELACVANLVTGFSKCRVLKDQIRPAAASSPQCDRSRLRSHRRWCQPTPQRPLLPSPCPADKRCDQAVLIAGGWREEAGGRTVEANVRLVYRRLREVGFQIANIQTFVSDGRVELRENLPDNFHPAGESKVAIRHHLQTLCSVDHCAGALVIYLNNPMRIDGEMLLWDRDENGEVSPDEKYSLVEFLADISECAAKSVFILVDQNFGGDLVRILHSRQALFPRTTLLAASDQHDYSNSSVLTQAFFASDLSSSTVAQIEQDIKARYQGLRLASFVGDGVQPATIFGSTSPNMKDISYRDNLAGCVSLSPSVWLSKYLMNQ